MSKTKKGKGKQKQKQSETAGSKLINKLALLRNKAKLSLRKLSQKSGIPLTALWRYERGEAPRVDVAFQIARALNRTVESVWPTATKGVKRVPRPKIKAKAKRKVKAKAKVKRVHKPTRKPKVKAQIRVKVVKARPKRVRVRKPKSEPVIDRPELMPLADSENGQ